MTIAVEGGPAETAGNRLEEDYRQLSRASARRKRIAALIRWGLIAGLVVCWQLYGSSSDYASLLVSTPADTLSQLGTWARDSIWWDSVRITLVEASAGYAVGVIAAMALVTVTAGVPILLRVLTPFISALNALPKIALAPVFILWFGTGISSKTLFVASLVTFMVYYATLAALQTLDQALISNARIQGASRLHLVQHVYLPAMVSQIVTTLRLGGAWALLAAVIGEYLAASQGLGFVIAQAQRTFQTDGVVAGILVVAVIATILDRVLVSCERRWTRWSPSAA